MNARTDETAAPMGIAWLLVTLALAALLFAWLALGPKAGPANFAYLAGQGFGVALLPTLILYLVWLRKIGPAAGLITFGVCWLAATAGGLAGANGPAAREQQAQTRAAVAGMKADIDAIGEQNLEDPTGRIEPLATEPTADNEAARMHAVMREFMNSVVTVRNTYLGELTALGWDGILDADRLKRDAGMADSRRMIAEARAAMARAEAASVQAFADFPALVGRAGLSASNRRDMIAGFDASKARGMGEMKQNFALEAQTIDEFEGIIELLARVQWEAQDAQILFHTDADVAAFNSYLERINALTEQLQQRQRASLERAQQSLRRIES